MSAYIGKNILISGANRGIGLSLVDYLCRANEAKLIFAGVRNPSKAKELEALATKYKPRIVLVQLDVTDEASIRAAADLVAKQTDEDGLDVLINNAGIKGQQNSVEKFDRKSALETYNVNVLGVAQTTIAFKSLLEKASAANKRPAKILNISSGLGSRQINSLAILEDFIYPGSKAALNMYTHVYSVINKHLLVLSMCPGHIQTELGGSHAPLTVDDAIPEILKTLANVTIKDTGRYVDRFGETITA